MTSPCRSFIEAAQRACKPHLTELRAHFGYGMRDEGVADGRRVEHTEPQARARTHAGGAGGHALREPTDHLALGVQPDDARRAVPRHDGGTVRGARRHPGQGRRGSHDGGSGTAIEKDACIVGAQRRDRVRGERRRCSDARAGSGSSCGRGALADAARDRPRCGGRSAGARTGGGLRLGAARGTTQWACPAPRCSG